MWIVGLVVALAALLTEPGAAQEAGAVAGRVTLEDGSGLAGVEVSLVELQRTVVSGDGGGFRFDGVPSGRYRLRVSHMGYTPGETDVRVQSGRTAEAMIDLSREAVNITGVTVSVVRPDMVPESELDADQARQANPRDPGELVREIPGIDAVRRGPIGLDPSVRGLRETEVGAYVDGARTFPAGPARMDSQLGHIDPTAIRSIQVVKGPYALTWGAGNLSAVRVETQDVSAQVPLGINSTLSGGYDANLGATETSASVLGRSGDVAYWGFGAWRQGDDYSSGNGDIIPGDFSSWEGRGKLGIPLGESSRLTLNGGHQRQSDIDYPGRLLNARFFRTSNGSARLQVEPAGNSVVRSLDVLAYIGNVNHDMTNDGKPTAQPDPDRKPPFALDVGVGTESTTLGGRAAVTLAPGYEWTVELGTDVYGVNRDAVRTVRRRDNDMLVFEDQVWPDVTIADAGAFARVDRRLGSSLRVAATGRIDRVSADAVRASEFFRENVSSDLDRTETNLSGALTLSLDVGEHWTTTAGAGTVVRTADALERYSDRFPASKAQTAAEFVGNPGLSPERSTQGDLWIEADYPRVSFDFNGFVRRIDDFITLAPSPLPKRLPLSPNQVYRYVNGQASFRGFESSLSAALTRRLTAGVGFDYLWSRDDTLDEPALGIAPATGSVRLRYDGAADRYWVEGRVEAVSAQDRVAVSRGETPTDGYTTADLKAGLRIFRRISLRTGVLNLFDAEYVNHLNSKNPFTGMQIPEPGRVVFLDVSVGLR